MLLGRIAPASCIVWESIVWGAEVGGRDCDRARATPFWVIRTPNLETSTTAQAIVEQGCAQSCSIGPISLAVQVSITTSPTCISGKQIGYRRRCLGQINKDRTRMKSSQSTHPLFQRRHPLHRKLHEHQSNHLHPLEQMRPGRETPLAQTP